MRTETSGRSDIKSDTRQSAVGFCGFGFWVSVVAL
jgi:hypothetical protein